MPKKKIHKLLSIIIPIYNESENVKPLYVAVTKQLKKMSYDYEILFIDDGSRDDSLRLLARIAKNDTRVRILEFARNFGKEPAVTAGLHAAAGDAVILMDADLQHPPSHLIEFVEKWEKGSDVVVGAKLGSNEQAQLSSIDCLALYRILT